MIQKPLESLLPSRDQVEFEVRRARESAALSVATRFSPDQFDEQAASDAIATSIFRDHAQDLPAENPERMVAYNIALTEAAVTSVLAEVESPWHAPFIAARAVELGAYALLHPDRPDARHLQHLGPSKQAGYFFTPPQVALEMAKGVLRGRTTVKHCLDPAAGTGALLAAISLVAHSCDLEIECLRAIELDYNTSRYCQQILGNLTARLGVDTTLDLIRADAIEFLQGDRSLYDVIIMNPPYGRVKFLSTTLTNAETRTSVTGRSVSEQKAYWRSRAAEQSDRYKTISRGLGLGGGRQDYQRLFLGLTLEVLAPGGRLACISPASWLGDFDSTPLRKVLVERELLDEVWLYPEDSGLFPTVNQVTAVTVIDTSHTRADFTFDIRSSATPDKPNTPYGIEFSSIMKLDPERMRIPKVDKQMHDVLEAMQSASRLGEVAWIRNARGELDQTANGSCITAEESNLRLIRGDHVERFVLRSAAYSDRPGYVNPEAFGREVSSAKLRDREGPRLVGRQVSYLNKPRRLSWTHVPAGVVVGNSCNYIVAGESCPIGTPDEYLWATLGVLNSAAIEWFFRVFNSNNHVANYEVDELPNCITSENIQVLAAAAQFLDAFYRDPATNSESAGPAEDLLDALVCFGFGLTPEQSRSVVMQVEPERATRVAGMVAWLSVNGYIDAFTSGSGWYQHIESSLSEHDREVISYIPQGGNWTSIPEDVPSKRLEQIREMTRQRGGLVRTSYYGRLRPDQPSYTIATYYNRPGNGTNIPPWENRVLTSREAARLQSFPDWYVFASKEAGVRKQIGNAVPPLLAYALGKRLAVEPGPTCVDLFSGAGGLSLGLELAGVNVVGACDNDSRASATYTLNRPCEMSPDPSSGKTLYIEADLSAEDQRLAVAESFRAKLGRRQLDLLVGGPPCQGFSHAGFRAPADQRNDLAAAFLEFVELLQPEIAILENVDGLLSYGGGRVVRELLETFRELGYETGASPWLLNAECYGVPQMRRRVFLVASRLGHEIAPPTPTFQKCLGRREGSSQPNLFSATDPYPVTTLDALHDLPRLGEIIHPSTGQRNYRPHFAAWARGESSVDEMLDRYRENI